MPVCVCVWGGGGGGGGGGFLNLVFRGRGLGAGVYVLRGPAVNELARGDSKIVIYRDECL